MSLDDTHSKVLTVTGTIKAINFVLMVSSTVRHITITLRQGSMPRLRIKPFPSTRRKDAFSALLSKWKLFVIGNGISDICSQILVRRRIVHTVGRQMSRGIGQYIQRSVLLGDITIFFEGRHAGLWILFAVKQWTCNWGYSARRQRIKDQNFSATWRFAHHGESPEIPNGRADCQFLMSTCQLCQAGHTYCPDTQPGGVIFILLQPQDWKTDLKEA